MEATDTERTEGRAILGIFGRHPQTAAPVPDAGGGRAEKKPSERTVSALTGLSTMVALGATVTALIHGQFYGLLWMLPGLAAWLLLVLVVRSVKAPGERKPAGQPGEGAPPDEGVIVAVDRLKERAASGVFGPTPRAKGATAWLTDDGIYLANNKCLSWSQFASFHLETPSKNCHHVRLRDRVQPTLPAPVALTLLLLVLAGGIVDAFGAWAGFHRYGLRDDVLAVGFMTIATLALVGSFFLLYTTRRRRLRETAKDSLALVDRHFYSDEAIVSLVSRHLPMESTRAAK